ncbi:MAG: glycosyltransferase, partial [Propionibacteriaceae bacterium]
MKIIRQQMDMAFVCRQLVQEMRSLHPGRTFVIKSSGDTIGLWDRPRIGQVFSNLLGNAVQYGFTDLPIDITVSGETDAVSLSVRNQGIPIPRDKVAGIFDAMVRGELQGGPHRTVGMTVDVILPCLNEADALPQVIGRLPEGYRAVVVDNGSTDGSADVARSLGAVVVTEPVRGFGSACAAGVTAATAEFVAFCDADASMDPAELPDLVARVADGRVDLALGRRVPTSRDAWAPHARFANRVLAVLMHRATGYRLRDLGPMRVMRREDLVALDLQDRRSGYPLEMVLAAHAAGWRVDESDIGYAQRIGDSKVTGTLRGTVNA